MCRLLSTFFSRVCVCERERESVCVCVCVRERESERLHVESHSMDGTKCMMYVQTYTFTNT